jgi:D-alanyl-D-alanine carboxypeptidase/D-alanyl-D-alanine-endopeptidase (penicillin-binding protein 4)
MHRFIAVVFPIALAACGGAARPVVSPHIPLSGRVARLHGTIDRLLAARALERGTWGVVIQSLDRGEILYSLNPRKLLTPASTMKIVTLAAAAERLGWDYVYDTQVLGIGAIDVGFLDGDLLVVGSGDPSIDDWDGSGTRLFQSWAERLKALGVRRVSGRIVGDDDAFEDEGLGAGWAWDDLGLSYAARTGALQFNQNSARIDIRPGSAEGAPADVTVRPEWAELRFRNLIRTAPAGIANDLSIRPIGRDAVLELRGSVGLGGAIVRYVAVENPTRYFVSGLLGVLTASGIDVHGGAVDIDDLGTPIKRSDGSPLLTHRSLPLAALAGTMMKLSQNMYAETLLKTLGRPSSGTGSTAAGLRAVRETLDLWGIDPAGMQMADGSGLSRYNLMAPETLVAVLSHVYRQDRLRAPFLAALPVAGRDGTLADRMKGTPAEGNARAKTGSLSSVRALAGYVRTADNDPLAFAVIANNVGVAADEVDKTMDAIVVELAAFTR